MVPADDDDNAPLVTIDKGDFVGAGGWGGSTTRNGTSSRERTPRGSVVSVDDWSIDGGGEMAKLRAQHAQRTNEDNRRRELERYYLSKMEFAHTDPVVQYEASVLRAANSNLREKNIIK